MIPTQEELKEKWMHSSRGVLFLEEVTRLCDMINKALEMAYIPGGMLSVNLFKSDSNKKSQQGAMLSHIINVYKKEGFDVQQGMTATNWITIDFKFSTLSVGDW